LNAIQQHSLKTESTSGFPARGNVFDRGAEHLAVLAMQATQPDEFLRTVDDLQHAVLMHIPHIAGVEPTLVIDHVTGNRRVVAVAPHHLGPAYPHFTECAWRHVISGGDVHDSEGRVGHRVANRRHARIGPGHEMGKRHRLGQTVRLPNGTSEPVSARSTNGLRQRRGERNYMSKG
jgi:hypothetical protein